MTSPFEEMSWIKLNTELAHGRAVHMAARILKCPRTQAFGMLLDWLCWLDTHSTDGKSGLLPAQINDELGTRNAATALVECGWAYVEQDGTISANEWEKHNGATAKKRAQDARRQESKRNTSPASVTEKQDSSEKSHAPCVTEAGNGSDISRTETRPREREEYNKENTLVGNTQLFGVRKLSLEQAKDFSVWMQAMHTCHPVTAMRPANSVLPADIEDAAVTAFLSFPNAPQYAAILADYMRSKQETDNHRTPYFRPNSESMFFSKLGDWIGHAQRWNRERPRRTVTAPSVTTPKPEQPNATEQEQDEMLSWLANNKTTTHTTNQQ